MIKNVALKVFLQNTVFSLFSCLNQRLKHNDRKIMLYSNLGFRDNVKALYDYIIEAGYNEKYTIICSTNDYKSYQEDVPKNVKFVNNIKGILEYFSAGFVYYCFGKIPIIPGKKQEVIQMWHGSPFKQADQGMLQGHSFDRPYYTHVLSASQNFVPFWSWAFSIPQEKVIVNGHPRCDSLYKENPKYDFGEYDKLILWTPTFRTSKVTGYSDTKDSKDAIIPILKSTDFERVDKYLMERNMKLVVKLHPLQDLSKYELTELKNFILLSQPDFNAKMMDLYRFMKQADALITDYSSIFYDYLLLDRPIGFTEDDMEDYGSTRGYAVDDPNKYRPGMRIRTIEDLESFIESIAQGKDEYVGWRHEVLDMSNDQRDGHFSKHALESVGINMTK